MLAQTTKGATDDGKRRNPSCTYKNAACAMRMNIRREPIGTPFGPEIAAGEVEPTVFKKKTRETLLRLSHLH